MSHVPFFCILLTSGLVMSSSLRILNKRLSCSRPMQGLDYCKISNCSDKRKVVPNVSAPTGPERVDYKHLRVGMDAHGHVPVVDVTWELKSDASLFNLSGSEINILDESTNQSMCVQYSVRIRKQLTPSSSKWTFSLDEVVVEPGHTYTMSVFNLPELESGDTEIMRKQIKIPGCDDGRIQNARFCLENGSLWDPRLTTDVSVDRENRRLAVVVGFETARFSERYQVSLESNEFHCSENVFKENRTSLNVTLEFDLWKLSQCQLFLTIQPFFVQCKNDCWSPKKIINYCHYYPPRSLIVKGTVGLLIFDGFLAYLLWRAVHKAPVNASSSTAKEQTEGLQVQGRKRVLIIYSLDHPLYRNIILKLCTFLATKCGTEVVLDLLDSTRLGVLGSIQWLDWHREQIESSSDKILILCSPGVQVKWKAMCGNKQVFLREDARSPVGDMLTPALSLMVPQFIRSASFEKYIVAYFDEICSEDDVPSPFNITVRYKMMKQFEELFFRILDTEKHQPGRANHIEGLSEDDYHQCPSGRALRDAIEAFQAYQLDHPQWFEDELLDGTELEVEDILDEDAYGNAKTTTNLVKYSVPDFTDVISLVKTEESDLLLTKQDFMQSSLRCAPQLN